MDLAILTPTRGRPGSVARLLTAVCKTASLDVAVFLGVDDDDEMLEQYREELAVVARPMVYLRTGPRTSLAEWTNILAVEACVRRVPFLASLGDDHVPATPGWDRTLVRAVQTLPGPGWAYGNDMFQGSRLPTAWVQSSALFHTLGWVMPPDVRHMYVDNVVMDLGKATDRIVYRPDVTIEHRHALTGRAPWDPVYVESNRQGSVDRDRRAYEAWRRDRMDRDAAAVAALSWEG
jgi:hypothetical protein